MYIKLQSEILKGTDQLGEVGVNEMIILKCILEK